MFADLLEEVLVAPAADLDARVRANELALRALQAERAALLAATAHAAPSAMTVTGRSAATCGPRPTSLREATRQRTIADACNLVPELGDALAAGRVGEIQIFEIARIASNPRTREFFTRVAPIYVELAEHASHDDLRDEITSFLNLADQDGAFAELCCQIEQRTAAINVVGGSARRPRQWWRHAPRRGGHRGLRLVRRARVRRGRRSMRQRAR